MPGTGYRAVVAPQKKSRVTSPSLAAKPLMVRHCFRFPCFGFSVESTSKMRYLFLLYPFRTSAEFLPFLYVLLYQVVGGLLKRISPCPIGGALWKFSRIYNKVDILLACLYYSGNLEFSYKQRREQELCLKKANHGQPRTIFSRFEKRRLGSLPTATYPCPAKSTVFLIFSAPG